MASLLFNLDRSWLWVGSDFYGFAEYFRNGFGETSLDQAMEEVDPMVLALAASVSIAIALAGCLVPAREAAQVDPSVALRSE